MRYIICIFSFLILESCTFFQRNFFVSETTVNRKLSSYDDYRQNAVFFEQSIRRDPYPEEMKPVLKVFNNITSVYCTAFFISNKENRFFVGTHSHCAQYQFENICGNESRKYEIDFKSASTGSVGFCQRVVARTKGSDFLILELEFSEANLRRMNSKNITFLKLARFKPQIGVQLRMIGHPVDNARLSRITVTENCQVNPIEKSVVLELTEEEKENLFGVLKKLNKSKSEEEKQNRSQHLKKAEFAGHNCTTYGGNSGGPMLIKNTPVVVGLPGGFFPNFFKPMPSHSSMLFETTNGFINELESVILNEGIELINYEEFKSNHESI